MPATGLQVFNLSTSCLELNVGEPDDPIWVKQDCTGKVETLQCANASVDIGLTVQTDVSQRTVTVRYSGSNGGAQARTK